MGLTIVTVAALTSVAAVLIVSGQRAALSGHRMSPIPTHPTSPIDEAERILTTRYVRGEITPDEYSRMLALLRR